MNTLQTTPPSEEPTAVEKISRGDMAFICARNQHQAHNLLLSSLKESRMSQKQLAARIGIDEAVISRVLRRPRNMELNTFSKLFYGLRGAALDFSPAYSRAENVSTDIASGAYPAATPDRSFVILVRQMDTTEVSRSQSTVGDTSAQPIASNSNNQYGRERVHAGS